MNETTKEIAKNLTTNDDDGWTYEAVGNSIKVFDGEGNFLGKLND